MHCLLIIGSLCFADAQAVEITESSTIARWAFVQVGDAQVEIQISGDLLAPELNLERMEQACAEGACVRYHKWCVQEDSGVTCHYSTADRELAEWLKITAPDLESYALLEKSISLIVGNDAKISLGLLSEVSRDRGPPFCRRGGSGPQCPD